MVNLYRKKGRKRRDLFRGTWALLFLFCSLVFTLPTPAAQVPDFPDDYRKVHFDAVVADMHNDVVQRILGGEDLSKRTTRGHSDLPRFAEGGLDIEMFSIWVHPERKNRSYFAQANEQIDSLESLARRAPDRMGIARNEKEIRILLDRKKFVAMLGLEGGHHIGNDLANLEYFYKRGVRYMTLTWNNSTSWATSAYDESVQPQTLEHKGLNTLGKKIVGRMNELGMIVDISHVGEQTFWDVMKVAKKPVIASHSSVWRLCPHRRNLKDDQLKAIAAAGGVVFINFLPNFIDSTFSEKERRLRETYRERIDSLRATRTWEDFQLQSAIAEMLKDEYGKIRPPLRVLMDHFDYAIKLIGADHVGLGSDFDGIHTTPLDLDDVTFLPNITRELLQRGYSTEDVRKVLGGNFLRIIREVCK